MQGIMGKFLEGQTGLSSPEIPSDCSEDQALKGHKGRGGWWEELGLPGGWQGA